MLARIKNLLVRSALYIAVCCAITIAILSLMDLSKAAPRVTVSDKFSHIIAYFFLTFFWLYGLIRKKPFTTRIVWVAFGCFIYGIIIEVLQVAITTYRTASYLDALANFVGIVVAVLAFYLFEKKNRLI